MKTLILISLSLVACGTAPSLPAPECVAPVAGDVYPLATTFDGSRGREVYSSPVAAPTSARAIVRMRNAAGNGQWNRTQLRVEAFACDGSALGAVTAFDVLATERAGEWLDLEADVDLSAFRGRVDAPDVAQLVLFVTPLYAGGAHEVEIEAFTVGEN